MRREMADHYGLTVLSGPFRGMKYSESSLLCCNGISVICGTYELELGLTIEEVVSGKYDRIIDIGCAECYAVGLAMRTGAVVHAFECDPEFE